jgi:hypothetical protein
LDFGGALQACHNRPVVSEACIKLTLKHLLGTSNCAAELLGNSGPTGQSVRMRQAKAALPVTEPAFAVAASLFCQRR